MAALRGVECPVVGENVVCEGFAVAGFGAEDGKGRRLRDGVEGAAGGGTYGVDWDILEVWPRGRPC